MYYTAEQEGFREEVRAWFEENIPMEMRNTPGSLDPRFVTPEELEWRFEFQRKLGEKRWLDPIAPTEYGGGGMSVDQASIIDEVSDDYQIPRSGDLGVNLGTPALLVYGSEEAKQFFLPKILGGEVITWQFFSEPDAGTDLAGVKATAEWNEEEQVWIINGIKHYGGGPFYPPDLMADYGWGPFVTEPDAPRHQNLTGFFVPLKQPGVTIQALDMIHTRRITAFLDNVRVPDSHRIGERGQGWRVINATLEREHGGGGSAVAKPIFREDLFAEVREKGFVRGNPEAQDALVQYFVESEVERLFNTRNYWMRANHIRWAWEGSQASMWSKMSRSERSEIQYLDALGPYALLEINDPRTVIQGRVDTAIRCGQATVAGGSTEAQKIIMGRRIGIGRHVRSQAHAVA
jgi:alkylation response protein AidB-like acyl-CoA dehydrogenase